MYSIFVLFSGLLGTAFSVLIRMELSGPGIRNLARFALHLSEISSLLGAMNFITTVLNMRSYSIRLHNLNGRERKT